MMVEPSAAPSLSVLVPGAERLPDDLLEHIDRHASLRDVAPGAILLRQHAMADELIVLVDGTIATLVEFVGTGDLVVETTDRPGRIFGWSALRPPRRATATVRADRAGQILVVPLDAFPRDRPRWAAAIDELVAASLADRVRDLQASVPTMAERSDLGDHGDA